MHRILKKNGQIAILEPSIPTFFPLKQIYNLYFQILLPKIGGWFSKDTSAYSYLPNSVKSFPAKKQFLEKLKKLASQIRDIFLYLLELFHFTSQ